MTVSVSEILVLLAESKQNVNIIIRGPSPKDIWQQIFADILNADQVLVEFLSPSDIFAKTRPFPLTLDDIPSIPPSLLSKFDDASRQSILNGQFGEVQHPPTYPWSFPDEISMKKSRKFQDLQILKLKSPCDGWGNLHQQQQFKLVSSVFESLLGFYGIRQFKLEKVVLLPNPSIENKFKQTYHEMENQLDIKSHRQGNKFNPWQEAITNLKQEIEKSGVKVLQFSTSQALMQWLSCSSPEIDIRITSNKFRKGDEDESAGVRLCQWLQHEWSHIPFMLFCEDAILVKDLPKGDNVRQPTKREKDLLKFALQ